MANSKGKSDQEMSMMMMEGLRTASSSSSAPPPPAAAAAAAAPPWGSHSPSATKFVAVKAGEEGMGDFRRYMSEKQRKLREQFQADLSSPLYRHIKVPTTLDCPNNQEASERSLMCRESSFGAHLFEGVSIFVNGLTIPSHSELRGLMVKYGGRFENYFSRSRVTHVICSTLPDSKIKDSRSFSRGLPIVKPEWIVDSIRQGRLLHWETYQPERIAYAHPHQRKLSSFFLFDKRDIANKNTSHSKIGACSTSEIEVDLSDEVASEYLQEIQENSNVDPIRGAALQPHVQLDEEKVKMAENDNPKEEELSEGAAKDARSDSSINEETYSDGKIENEITINENGGSPGNSDRRQNDFHRTGPSTSSDDNFVHNYFKHSRLHFIGTWRSRYLAKMGERPQQINESLPNQTRTIIHIDMGCFFVAVVVRNRPEMAAKPLAVCHSDSAHGTAEISSANYVARGYGVHAGMFVRDAKGCCPSLEIVPYDFEGYEEVAEKFYDILHKHCTRVQALSCDEAYLDVTGQGNPESLAESIRNEIFNATRCTASAGIGANLLLARLATKKAKPDGQYHVKADEEEQFLANLLVDELPGVGWALKEKLHDRKIFTCEQLRTIAKNILQNEFGSKTGNMLWCYCRGVDNREVVPAKGRKTIGADVNWGVRFVHHVDVQKFLTTLCEEVTTRLQRANVRGRMITLKIKRRKRGAEEPAKFMGCGSCDNLSRSTTLAYATNKADALLRIAEKLYDAFHLEPKQIRGVGLHVAKLETVTISQSDLEQKGLTSWLDSCSIKASPLQRKCKASSNVSLPANPVEMENEVESARAEKIVQAVSVPQESSVLRGLILTNEVPHYMHPVLPPMSQLDRAVLESLPPEIYNEIDNAYNGLLASKKTTFSTALRDEAPADKLKAKSNAFMDTSTTRPPSISTNFASTSKFLSTEHVHMDDCQLVKTQCCKKKHIKQMAGADDEVLSSPLKAEHRNDVMPTSFSQIDKAVLEELPTQIQLDLVHVLPAHSNHTGLKSVHLSEHHVAHGTSIALLTSPVLADPKGAAPTPCTSGALQNLDDIWSGSPPKWLQLLDQWSGPGSRILRTISSQYQSRSANCSFPSFILSLAPLCDGTFFDISDFNEVVHCVFEIVRQYIQSAVRVNLEEVWTLLRLVRRLSSGHRFWSEIQNLLLPCVQEYTLDIYGGILTTGG